MFKNVLSVMEKYLEQRKRVQESKTKKLKIPSFIHSFFHSLSHSTSNSQTFTSTSAFRI